MGKKKIVVDGEEYDLEEFEERRWWEPPKKKVKEDTNFYENVKVQRLF